MPCPIEEIRWPSTVTEADLTRCRTAEATHISYWLLGPGEIALRAPFMVNVMRRMKVRWVRQRSLKKQDFEDRRKCCCAFYEMGKSVA